MATRKPPPPALYLQPGDPDAMRKVTIGTGEDDRNVTVPAAFSAVFDLRPAGAVRLDLEADHGRIRVVAVQVTEVNGDGVTGLTLDSVPLSQLLSRAAESAAFMASTVGFPDAREAAASASRRRRRAVGDDRLAAVGEAYERGGIEAVSETEGVSERQAYRLLARARAAGLAPEGER